MNLEQLTEEQLQDLLKKKKAEKAAEELKMKEAYENLRENFVRTKLEKAKGIYQLLKEFKKECVDGMEDMRAELLKYSKMNARSKGGFGLRSKDGKLQIRLDLNRVNDFDERAAQGIDLIKQFLEDKVKKRSQEAYKIVMRLLEKNQKGDIEPSRVLHLIKMENDFEEESWKQGIKLLKESYAERQAAYNISFTEADATGKDQYLTLSFSSIQMD